MGDLYHYTSMQCFESIIKNQSIRMTRSDFMNDPYDCKVFYTIVKKHIEEKMKDIEVEHYLRNVKNKNKIFPKDVSDLIKKYPLNKYLEFVYNHISLYIFSMTDRKDSLSMWNYYGSDGICFGVDQELFLENFKQKICKHEFDFLAYTNVNYIDINSDDKLNDLPLYSLTDIQLLNSSNDDNYLLQSLHEYKKDDENVDLKLLVESYIESYIVSINYLLRNPINENKSFEEFYKISSIDEFYKKIFYENRKLMTKKDMRFKSFIDIFMLILSAKYKPKTFESESETRIVFFNYNIPQEVNEKYAAIKYDFGSFLKPFIECKFEPADNALLSNEIRSIILSPATNRIPIDKNTYKRIISKFLNKDDSFSVEISEHDIRW